MSLPRYEEYKDCSTQWLVQIPEHWSTPPLYLRYEAELGKMLDTSRITGESLLPYLRNVDVQWGCINLDDLPEMDVGPSEISRYTVQQGDLLVCEGGEVGRSAVVGELVRPTAFQKALHRLRAIRTTEVPGYMLYVFRWAADAGAFASNGQSTIAHLTGEQLRKYRFPCPPQAEQTAIAAFLDRETAKIDALIAEQEKLIALLAEKRQATISHAVTRGLNPDAPMKDSGVAWLGEVPAHWLVRRMKTVSPEITVGIVVEPSKYYVDDGVPALRSLNILAGRITTENMVYISEESNNMLAKSRLRAGDLVSVRSGQTGVTAVVPDELDGCNCIDLIILRRPLQDCGRFLCWYFASDTALLQFALGSGGAIQQHFNIGMAMNLCVPLPPIEEQRAIADCLDSEASQLDALRAEAERGIKLLKERRSALIAAAVTGQIDVRSAVAPRESA